MTKVPIFADDNGYTGWVGRSFSIPTIPGERDRSLFPNLEQALTSEIGSIASWALAMDRQEAIDILQGRSVDQEVHRAQATAASGIDSLSGFIDKCLVPSDPLILFHSVDLIDAYRLFCRVTGKHPLADGNFIGQLRTALPHLEQPRRRLARTTARERGIDEDNRWLPRRFFGFSIDEAIWRRDVTDELPHKAYEVHDPRNGINWEHTLSNWEEAGLAFEWNRDSKRPKTGFIHRDSLLKAEGRLMQLGQHKPEAPDG
jgi:hypothetical protein